jgi:hypothetical protein
MAASWTSRRDLISASTAASFAGQFPVIRVGGAHFDKGAHHEDAHLDGLCAIENIRQSSGSHLNI